MVLPRSHPYAAPYLAGKQNGFHRSINIGAAGPVIAVLAICAAICFLRRPYSASCSAHLSIAPAPYQAVPGAWPCLDPSKHGAAETMGSIRAPVLRGARTRPPVLGIPADRRQKESAGIDFANR